MTEGWSTDIDFEEDFPSSMYSILYPLKGPFKLVVLGVYDMNLTKLVFK